jgi:pimeloyl-ACP methyl ester carboxylesterase
MLWFRAYDQGRSKTMTNGEEGRALGAGSYAEVNGLEMYYEIHGAGQPLVLLHGAFSAIGTSFGSVLPELAKTRQVIAFELQAHGRTADIDRPLSIEQMADDTAAALRQLGIERADIFGYSLGAGVGLHVAIRHPEVVRKLVLASVTYNKSGLHPGLMEGLANMKAEDMVGSPWHEEYTRIAPNPEDFPTLFAKKTQMDRETRDLPAEAIEAITAPTLLIIGDSDIVRPEHAVEMFRLLGGGVVGDVAGLPNSRLAMLPGTTHVTLVERADWLVSMIGEFLDAPMPEAG